jgi:hypothetical protein
VLRFSRQVLDVYDYTALDIIITLHNNAPTYSSCAYLPGGVYQNDAAAVYIGDTLSPRDFMYVTDLTIYEAIQVGVWSSEGACARIVLTSFSVSRYTRERQVARGKQERERERVSE